MKLNKVIIIIHLEEKNKILKVRKIFNLNKFKFQI